MTERPGIVVSAAGAAKLYGVSVFTIRRWCRAGKLEREKDPGGRRWRVIIRGPAGT